jgi:hypothetical protein
MQTSTANIICQFLAGGLNWSGFTPPIPGHGQVRKIESIQGAFYESGYLVDEQTIMISKNDFAKRRVRKFYDSAAWQKGAKQIVKASIPIWRKRVLNGQNYPLITRLTGARAPTQASAIPIRGGRSSFAPKGIRCNSIWRTSALTSLISP